VLSKLSLTLKLQNKVHMVQLKITAIQQYNMHAGIIVTVIKQILAKSDHFCLCNDDKNMGRGEFAQKGCQSHISKSFVIFNIKRKVIKLSVVNILG
jgi:hypothetical protein